MTTLNINGFEWRVYFVPENHKELIDENGTPTADGIALLRKGEIYINSELPKGMMEKIVTHELVHAVAHSYDVDLESVDEEKMCDFVGTFFDVIRENREIVMNIIR